ncbi:radical SAM protein [Goodfellowiella coeruleoviolacea]|uniref:Radical SAM additional 4Fe4S-binding SPASM domain-containing protein n=1 Tax=Goodfellowiella coeruleoviolacea TaxID=334858 RepID=A0AAE3G945_9PSEU|nr:radical SAM protein [Goodfellowiella coeruleoviolacea]MCP2163164.1 radical SAM additional 4Fe4S-binding SPASM domain-containing protein [Goodfellowiella coeruleoviolacea]
MHPRTARTLNRKEFEDLRRTVAIRAETRRNIGVDAAYATPMPREVSMQLTYRCNLRCNHCYQWNDQGFFHDFSKEKQRTELDVAVVDDVLRATDDTRAKVFLWGGEPLMHKRFGDIAALLARNPRTVVMCTNGLLLERHVDDLLTIGPGLNILVSLDGRDDDHEALRGRGTFPRTVRNIQSMLDLQRSGEYQGEISISCMVSNETVGKMYDFMEWAEALGVNTVYFQFPWYISPDVARSMDELYERCFSWLNPPAPGTRPTWHSYTYRLKPELIDELKRSMTRLAERTWNVRIRYQPQLEIDEVEEFILGVPKPAQQRNRCLAVSNRLEVHADGKVSSCKFFPEFVIGDLYDNSVAEVWQGEAFRRVREVLRGTSLMPVCSRCILLYLNGV